MNIWEAIATGFDGGFVLLGPRRLGVGLHGKLSESERTWRADRVWEALRRLGAIRGVVLILAQCQVQERDLWKILLSALLQSYPGPLVRKASCS